MDIFLYLGLFVMAMMVIFRFRNRLVHEYRMKAIKETSKKAKAAIKNDGDWEKYYIKLDNYDTYNKMVLDIRKWTYRQFYPDL